MIKKQSNSKDKKTASVASELPKKTARIYTQADIQEMLKWMHKIHNEIDTKLQEVYTLSGLSNEKLTKAINELKIQEHPDLKAFEKESLALEKRIQKANLTSAKNAHPAEHGFNAGLRPLPSQPDISPMEKQAPEPHEKETKHKFFHSSKEKTSTPDLSDVLLENKKPQPTEKAKPFTPSKKEKLPQEPATHEPEETKVVEEPGAVSEEPEAPLEKLAVENPKEEEKKSPSAPSSLAQKVEQKKAAESGIKDDKGRKGKTLGARKGWISMR